MVIWLIGLSGAGKTTIGRGLYERLKKDTRHLVYLDGDDFREIFMNDADHSIDGRRKNAERISHFCRVLDHQGIHVIASVLSIFPDWQAWNRNTFSNYYEVFLNIPLQTLKDRDPKGLYRDAEASRMDNVVGIDIPFPQPPNPDLVIGETDQQQGVEACIKQITASLPTLN